MNVIATHERNVTFVKRIALFTTQIGKRIAICSDVEVTSIDVSAPTSLNTLPLSALRHTALM